jgi:hypothetical protein
MTPIRLRHFILSTGGILLTAALIRFLVAAGNAQVLSLPDPVLGIPLRDALLVTGGFELAVAIICLFGKQVKLQTACLVWLTTNFAIYWVCLFGMHLHPQGSCTGSLTDPLHLSIGITGWFMSLLPICLLLGSYGSVTWLWLANGMVQPAKSFKMSCPKCGGKIKFASQNLGQKNPCPHCRTTIALRKPDLLKMACFFCQEHIEYPTHAIGEKMPCPHCKMDITLKEPA